jgi:hypothetical protein
MYESSSEAELQEQDTAEMHAYHSMMHAVSTAMLPRNFPQDLMPLLGPTGLYPDQMEMLLRELQTATPLAVRFRVRSSTSIRIGC